MILALLPHNLSRYFHILSLCCSFPKRDRDPLSPSALLFTCSITQLAETSVLPRAYSKAKEYQGHTVYKQAVLLLLGSSVHQEDVGCCMFSFLKLLPSTAADPGEECIGYPTSSGAGVWRGRDFLEMHIDYCLRFVLLSKDLSCVKMHSSLFAKACCCFSLQTATLPSPPQNNLNFPFQCQPGLAECHQSSMSMPWIVSSPGCQISA